MITRSKGTPAVIGGVCYGFPGGGYMGITEDLDATVQRAAELLTRAFDMGVEIRFNSDRLSGGAWLETPGTTDVAISADVITAESVARLAMRVKRYNEDDYWQQRLAEMRELIDVVQTSVYLSRRAFADQAIAAQWCEGTYRKNYTTLAVPSIEDGLTLIQALIIDPKEIAA
jgi:hypothetical protein